MDDRTVEEDQTSDAAPGDDGSGDRLRARLWERIRREAASARRDDLFLHAAALAFYGLVSVAPLVVVALWLTSLVVGKDELRRAASSLGSFAPPALGADRALQRVADLGTRVGLVAVVGALWPATAYGSGLVRVFDRVTAGGDRELKGLRGRGLALALVGLLPMLVLISLPATYAGAKVLGDGPVATALGLAVALLFGFVVTAGAVTVIYKVFPHRPPEWRATLRGTLVAATGISLVSVGYVAYLRLAANFEERYASDALAAVVLLAVWLFLANAVLLVGYRVARDADPQAAELSQSDRY